MTVNDVQHHTQYYSPKSLQRLQIIIHGIVQGVGFRPFIYRLAVELGLVGWVSNSAQGVVVELEGTQSQLDTLLQRIQQEKPPQSSIQQLKSVVLNPIGYSNFEIRASIEGEKTTFISPDLAICSNCLQDILDPSNRRYRYPFTNCTHCGPRFSIIEAIPYDRFHTTMRQFSQCPHCQAEYEDPANRRFHAQPNACPDCGPHLELWNRQGQMLAAHDQALRLLAIAIRQGKIGAVKGLGGFHFMVDARNQLAIQRLRQAKHRPAKPFALMYPSLELVQADCQVSDLEAQVLQSPEAPIVLLTRSNATSEIAPSVAPNNPYLGVMLPYTPLHYLLLHDLNFPVVATSGNLSDEPICTDETEAVQRLGQIADVFLVHNRPIARPIDDSVVRVILDQTTLLRRARGYAPLPPISLQFNLDPGLKLLATGAQLKNTIAFFTHQHIFTSQHIGDLSTVPAVEAFQKEIFSCQALYELAPTAIACDLHPDYYSTQFAHQVANQLKVPIIAVQHHYAHALSCMAEHQLEGTVLGITWDGTGYGLDGTIWGGEFLQVTDNSFQRVAHLRPFRLPGGEKAVQEPRRSAIGLLYELWGDSLFESRSIASVLAFSVQELQILKTMLNKNVNTPITSSAGRFFDAIASLIGLRQRSQFEAQAAMELEFAIATAQTDDYYPFEILHAANAETTAPLMLDWAEMVQSILRDISLGLPIAKLSVMFHNTLVEMMVAIAKRVEQQQVVLTGGCFQNQYLLKRAVQRLKTEGFQPCWHQRIPANDGGIAVGQIMAAVRQQLAEKK